MEIETKLISKEIIKPSSPTPKSLQKYQFSLLDQFSPPNFMPSIYYFSSSPKIPISQISNHLKKSLSKTLSTYYPLAGRRATGLYIDCNDGGVPFSEVEANCNLSQIIHDPDLKFITNLLTYYITESQAEAGLCIAVQATYFRCGGLTLGLLISHKIADALSGISFVNSWASVARIGDLGGVPIPKFCTAAAYFPPQDIPELNFNMEMMSKDVATTTLTFPAAEISLIREMYSGDGKQRPSRVEALTAYVWTQFLSATTTQSELNQIDQLMQPVNLRSLIDELPPSQYHFGNIYGISTTKTTVGDEGIEVWKKIRQANKSAYNNYMGMMKDNADSATVGETNTFPLNSMAYTSISGFPLYEADFGWGKPIWVSLPGLFRKNFIVLLDGRTKGDIDAIIHLSKQDMEKFEAHLKLQPVLKSKL